MNKSHEATRPRKGGPTKVKRSKKRQKKTPRTRKPQDMSLEQWQIALRREFGREQEFTMENIGDDPIFSEFLVTNPKSGGTYRVAIRGRAPGENYCSCPDFSVNTLGTCKHIEFTLAKLERKRGAKKAFREGFHPPYSEVYVRYGSKREVCFLAGKECPDELRAYASEYFGEDGVLKPQAYPRFHSFLKKAPRNGHELRCYEDTLQLVAQVRDDAQRRRKIQNLFPEGISSPRLKKLLKISLYPYQLKGSLFAANAGRCIIADDMGLGKTVQAIAAVEILARAVGVSRVLVIAPTSVKHQWKQEIERFSGRTVEVIEGLLAKRQEKYQTDTFYKITNYEVIHRDLQSIEAWAPDVVILDEAQRIKNWKTRRAQSVKRIQSDHAIVLTGTPLENRLEELHSIVEFVDRFRLGPLFRFLAEHQHTDDNGKVIGYGNLSKITETLEPILIRRRKKEVLHELPERIENHSFIEMTEEQWEHHEENRAIVARIVAKWRRLGFLSERDQRCLMIALQNMRMACNSTFLLDKTTNHERKISEAVTLLEEILESGDTKVVVFSQWIGTHELLLDQLNSRGNGYVFFHGSLDSRQRNAAIQRFKEDPSCRVFLSTDSGGVGLNLQHASDVINMDQPWNPAILEQRIGRVHRLGQQRNVRINHFVSKGTIEHGMLKVLAFKKSVFAGVLDGGENEVFLGGTRLKKFMETVEKATENVATPPPAQETTPEADDIVGADEVTVTGEPSVQPPAPAGAEAWEDLLSTGMEFIGKLGRALSTAQRGDHSASAPASLSGLVAKDDKTGESYLRVPLPEPSTLKKFADAFGALASAFQGQAHTKDDSANQSG